MTTETLLSGSLRHQVSELWLQQRQATESALRHAFVRHAIDNRGILNSTRRADSVASRLHALATEYLRGGVSNESISLLAVELTEQGIALSTGTALMRSLHPETLDDSANPVIRAAALQLLGDFQLTFLEKLAEARELHRMRVQERSQMALQHALKAQLDQQREMRRAQEERSANLDRMLRLNARLARITDENDLLAQAAKGVKDALALADVTIYELTRPEKRWTIRLSTDESTEAETGMDPYLLNTLEETVARDELAEAQHRLDFHEDAAFALMPLRVGKKVLGAIRFSGARWEHREEEESIILLRTFAQNLSAMWRNISLLKETRHRTHELEILHGRYMDRLWSSESATLRATYGRQGLSIERTPEIRQQPTTGTGMPIRIGERTVGRIVFPDDVTMSHDDLEFAAALIREMSNALNNARLLQTASSYSNQLTLAADVARAATTILDRDQLIQEVVELIRARFDVYYVGLFLVDEDGKKAVLRGGTGSVGRLQVSSGHHLEVGSHSMVGMAIAEARARVAHDVTKAEAFVFNPLLPETRSELALPLRLRGDVTGALSVQSSELGTFTDEMTSVMQSLADQVAVAIANAQLFEEIQSSIEQLRQLDTLKTQFLARMTHELRTPLNSIIGFSRVILKGIDGPLTNMQEEDLTSIHRNGLHLLTLINEILDMAKIDAGKMTLAFEDVDLQEAAREALSFARSLVDTSEVALEWDVEKDLPRVEADPVRLRQILMNLLSNAAKFTERGSIRLQINRSGSAVEIHVHDTGIGISAEDYGKIFTPFEQVNNAAARGFGGTGLGLPITQWLVNGHGGEISFESQVDEGTSFHISLPVRQNGNAEDDYMRGESVLPVFHPIDT